MATNQKVGSSTLSGRATLPTKTEVLLCAVDRIGVGLPVVYLLAVDLHRICPRFSCLYEYVPSFKLGVDSRRRGCLSMASGSLVLQLQPIASHPHSHPGTPSKGLVVSKKTGVASLSGMANMNFTATVLLMTFPTTTLSATSSKP